MNREDRALDTPGRKPSWLRVKAFTGDTFAEVSRLLAKHHLNTVCQSANCPNRGECFNRGTATFLIMGPNCSRNCRFCDVRPGPLAPLDPDEPKKLADVAAELKLKHVVVTSVTRDDLVDGGAAHFVEVVKEIRDRLPNATIELLIPDMKGDTGAWDIILATPPDILNHNIETVPRLYADVRPAASYRQSLDLLSYFATHGRMPVKSGLMVGLGETDAELLKVFADLAASSVSILTIGQYLRPSTDHAAVQRYVPPEGFDALADDARKAGIATVVSGPLVRSSYLADRHVDSIINRFPGK